MLKAGDLLQQRYRIERHLDSGGMSRVYAAVDIRLRERPVAIKAMDPSRLTEAEQEWAREVFRQEAGMLAHLQHRGLAQVLDFFLEEGQPYLVMEYVRGESLADRLVEAGRLPAQQALAYARELGGILSYLHSQRPPIIFRDLKPDNIMVQPDGSLKLIDFGIARFFKPGQRRDTIFLGTPGYAAPEQYGRGQSDARADVYGLGVLLHQMLSGHDPTTTPMNLPALEQLSLDLPPAVAMAVERATRMDPGGRFASIEEFVEALQETDVSGSLVAAPAMEEVSASSAAAVIAPAAVAEGVASDARRVAPATRVGKEREPAGRRRWLTVLLLLLLAASAAAGGLYLLGREGEEVAAVEFLAAQEAVADALLPAEGGGPFEGVPPEQLIPGTYRPGDATSGAPRFDEALERFTEVVVEHSCRLPGTDFPAAEECIVREKQGRVGYELLDGRPAMPNPEALLLVDKVQSGVRRVHLRLAAGDGQPEPAFYPLERTVYLGNEVRAAGAHLYDEYCATCHGDGGRAEICYDAGRAERIPCAAPPLNEPGLLCWARPPRVVEAGWEGEKGAYLHETIARGHANTGMEPLGASAGGPLEEAGLEAVTQFLLGWETDELCEPGTGGGSPWPARVAELPAGNPDEGAELFQAVFACAACHGDLEEPESATVGPWLGELARGAEAPRPGYTGADYIYESILMPDAFIVEGCPGGPCLEPSVMPQNFGERMGPQEMASLLAFLLGPAGRESNVEVIYPGP